MRGNTHHFTHKLNALQIYVQQEYGANSCQICVYIYIYIYIYIYKYAHNTKQSNILQDNLVLHKNTSLITMLFPSK